MMNYAWNFKLSFQTIQEYYCWYQNVLNILFVFSMYKKHYIDQSLIELQFITFTIQTTFGIRLQCLV
jgi:hypothetical protein